MPCGITAGEILQKIKCSCNGKSAHTWLRISQSVGVFMRQEYKFFKIENKYVYERQEYKFCECLCRQELKF